MTLERSGDGKLARVIVEDEGPGIPRDRRERVWEPFYRLDRDADSAVAGSGIGLSVVRELATKLGGSARIEDSRVGARVVVELPGGARADDRLGRADPPPAAPAASHARPTHARS